MANQFVNLPALAANGSGPAVDVSTFGALKTVAVQGNGGVFEPFVTVECSNQLVPTNWFPLWTFNTPTEKTFEVACHWMRVTVSNYRGGGAPTVDVGGTDDGATFAQLAVPPGNSVGAGTDVSALGLFKTVHVGGAFRGQLNVEVSEDGGVKWAQSFSFAMPGAQSQVIAADFMRVSRNGVPPIDPGTPTVWVGGANPVGGGGGALDVQMNEVDVVNPASTLDFQNPGQFVVDAGGGVAKIWGTLVPTRTPTFRPAGGATILPDAGMVNVIDSSGFTDPAFALAELPSANTVPNGTFLVLKLNNSETPDGTPMGRVIPLASLGDLLDNFYNNGGGNYPEQLTLNGQAQIWMSDGISVWWLVATTGNTTLLFPDEQAFIKTLAGTEDPAGFPVNMPLAMDPGSDYVVEITMGANTFLLQPAAILRTNTTITVELSAAPTAGDELLFFVKKVTGIPT